MVENFTFLTSVNMNALFFCIAGSFFTLKHEQCSVTRYTYFLYNFFLGLQLQLQICLLGVGKMNDFMMFVTECTKENQRWAKGRKFIIENLKGWEKPKRCMKITVFRLSGVGGYIWFWTSIVRSEAPLVSLFLSLTDLDFTNVGNSLLWFGGHINSASHCQQPDCLSTEGLKWYILEALVSVRYSSCVHWVKELGNVTSR